MRKIKNNINKYILIYMNINGIICMRMAPKKSRDYVNRSIRMPSKIWNSVKRISGRNYRSLNSQFIKIVEDWLEDRDYLDATERTKMDD